MAMGGGMGIGMGIGEAASQILGSVQGAAQARMADNRARKAASKARNWAEAMRATAYQTAVEDLELAGLNPILAVGGAPGSVTPSAPQASVGRTGGAGRSSFSRVVSSAKQGSAMQDELRTIRALREKAEADAAVAQGTTTMRMKQAEVDVRRGLSEVSLLQKQAEQSSSQRLAIDVNRMLGETELPGARAMMEMDSSEFGEFMRKVDRILSVLPSVRGSSSRGGSRWTGARGAAQHESRSFGVGK